MAVSELYQNSFPLLKEAILYAQFLISKQNKTYQIPNKCIIFRNFCIYISYPILDRYNISELLEEAI